MNRCGGFDKITGDLLRYGYCDFETDGSFDPATEEIRTDVPEGAIAKGTEGESQWTRYTEELGYHLVP